MDKVVVAHGFRFEGKYYPPSRKAVELPELVATFAISQGLAKKPRVTKNKRLKVKEVK